MERETERDRETDIKSDRTTNRDKDTDGDRNTSIYSKCGKFVKKMRKPRMCTQDQRHSMFLKHAANHNSLFKKIQ